MYGGDMYGGGGYGGGGIDADQGRRDDRDRGGRYDDRDRDGGRDRYDDRRDDRGGGGRVGVGGATIGAAVGDTTTAGTPPQPAPRWLILSVACLVLSRAECGSPSDDDLYRPLALCSPPCLRYLHS